MKTSTKISIISLILLFSLVFVVSGNAADGTTGNISCTNDFYYVNSPLQVDLESLTASGEYALNITAGCYPGADTNNQKVFDLGALETKKSFKLQDMRLPTAGGRTCTIILVMQSAGTQIDIIDVDILQVGDDIPTDFVTDLAVPLIIIGVVISLIGGIVMGKKKGLL